MKQFIYLLFLLPLFSCGNTNREFSDLAFDSEKNTASNIDHSKWDVLLKKHVSNQGNVDYKGFQKDAKALNEYLDYLAANVPSKSDTKNTVLAYWINVYNAFTVKLIVDNYPLKSIKDIKDPWGKKFFTLGDKKYSLEEVEHEILRKMDEPRIHFAINCASFSCPNLLNEAFVADKLDKQLTAVTKSFLADGTKNMLTPKKIAISEIFNWFAGDFKTKGTLVDFINQYSDVKIDAKAKISYKDYNWTLNE
uniref:DUF547 domain-containing protein n=1 Tax=Flavobacterium sp. TaxID=239 RepID=UPI00404B6193